MRVVLEEPPRPDSHVFTEFRAARQGYRELTQAILMLEEQPSRCPATPESNKFRHLMYGHKPHVYRVAYRILEQQKHAAVLHIRRGA